MKRLLCLFLCCGVLLLAACVPIGRDINGQPQPPEATAVPTYPGMQEAVTPESTLYANESDTLKFISLFQTQDKPDAVLTYYTRILTPNGWKADQVLTPGVQWFDWAGGCPEHRLSITAVSLPSGITTVEVKRYDEPCIGSQSVTTNN